jgi:hypothetical protein
MSDTSDRQPQAVNAFLAQKNIEISCTLVFEDESINYPQVRSVSMRGAQREMTGLLVAKGYAPAGRWSEATEDGDRYRECTRAFKPGPDAALFTVEFDGQAV